MWCLQHPKIEDIKEAMAFLPQPMAKLFQFGQAMLTFIDHQHYMLNNSHCVESESE